MMDDKALVCLSDSSGLRSRAPLTLGPIQGGDIVAWRGTPSCTVERYAMGVTSSLVLMCKTILGHSTHVW